MAGEVGAWKTASHGLSSDWIRSRWPVIRAPKFCVALLLPSNTLSGNGMLIHLLQNFREAPELIHRRTKPSPETRRPC